MRRIYIAGPMRGYPKFNFPAFDAAAAAWRMAGWEVISPAEMDREMDGMDENTTAPVVHSFAHYMRRDINVLLTVEAIAFLPGWDKSVGANVEKAVGGALGLKFYDATTFLPLPNVSKRQWTNPSMFPVLEEKLESFAAETQHHVNA